MLQALVEYAEREGLGDLDFEERPVDYELRIDHEGAFVGLIGLADGKKRPSLDGIPIGPPSKNNPGCPSFLVDNVQYVLGVSKQGAKAGNAEKCFASYADLVREAALATKDEGLVALAAFLDRPEQLAAADVALRAKEEKDADKRGDRVLVPALDGGAEPRLHTRPAVVSWWLERRALERRAAAEGPVARCLVTGRIDAVARTHPALKVSMSAHFT